MAVIGVARLAGDLTGTGSVVTGSGSGIATATGVVVEQGTASGSSVSSESASGSSLSSSATASESSTGSSVSSAETVASSEASQIVSSSSESSSASSESLSSSGSSVSSASSSEESIVAFPVAKGMLQSGTHPTFWMSKVSRTESDDFAGKIRVTAENVEGATFESDVSVTESGTGYLVQTTLRGNAKPGLYDVTLALAAGRGGILEYILGSEEKILWEGQLSIGQLIVNTDKETYAPNQDVFAQVSFLDADSNALCGKKVEAALRDASGKVIERVSTESDTIQGLGHCAFRATEAKADYAFQFRTPETGRYTLTVAATDGGSQVVSGMDFVVENPSSLFSVKRQGMTRGISGKTETMQLIAYSEQAVIGEIVDMVPAGFEVTEVSEGGYTDRNGDITYVRWGKRFEAGVSIAVQYSYHKTTDATTVDPFGPVTMKGSLEKKAVETASSSSEASSSSIVTSSGARSNSNNDTVLAQPVLSESEGLEQTYDGMSSAASSEMSDASSSETSTGSTLDSGTGAGLLGSLFSFLGSIVTVGENDSVLFTHERTWDMVTVPAAKDRKKAAKSDLMLEPTNEDVIPQTQGAAFTLLNVELDDTTLDSEGNLKESEALRAIVEATSDASDIERVLVEKAMEDASVAIATAISNDSVAVSEVSEILEEGSARRQMEAVQTAVQTALTENDTTRENVADLFRDDLAPILSTVVTDEVVEQVTQDILDGKGNTVLALIEEKNPDIVETIADAVTEKIEGNETEIAKTITETADESNTDTSASDLLTVTLTKKDGTIYTPDYHFERGSVVLVIEPEREFAPGMYVLTVTVTNPLTGETQTLTQDFAWGVLAMNPEQDTYEPGQTVNMALGVLNDGGHIVCDAELSLMVESPSGDTETLTIANEGITKTGDCGKKNSMSVSPDYITSFIASEAGTYRLTLTANTQNGERTMETELTVTETAPFVLKRTAATRLYPFGESPMTIEVTFNQAYEGTITERVPASFDLSQISPAGTIATDGDDKTITWNGSWNAGDTATLSYIYDAPDISPQFYLAGPVSFGDTYNEGRAWQIANDAGTPIYWIGTNTSTSDNWSDTSKWSTSATGSSCTCKPDSSQVATFTSSRLGNVSVNTNPSAGGVNIASGYTGTITATSGNSIDLFSDGWTQAGGTFVGSSSSIILNNAGSAFNQSGGTFTAPSGILRIDGGFTRTGGTFNHNNGEQWIGYETYNLAGGSTRFYNVTFRGQCSGGAKTITITSGFTASGTLTFQSCLSGNSAAVIGSGSPTITVEGATTISQSTTNPTTIGSSTAGSNITLNLQGNLTMSAANATLRANVTFLSSATLNQSAGTVGTGTWTINNSSATVTLSAFSSPANFTVTAGTLSLNGTNYSATASIANGATLKLQGGETVTTPTLSAGSIVEYVGSSTYSSLAAGNSYKNLTFNATGTWTLGATLDVDETLTLSAGTLDASSRLVTVGGNFIKKNAATFTASTSTIALDGTSQTLSGTTTFNNLRKKVTSADTLSFYPGYTTTVSGTWSMSGATSNLLSLRSSTNGTQWTINPTAYKLSYVDVKDSNNTGSQIVADGAGTTNSGNNTNWSFPISWVGGTGTNCSTAANWSSGAAPTSSDDVLINATSNSISWDSSCASTVSSLKLDTGFSGTVTLARSLTVTNQLTMSGGTFAQSSQTLTAATYNQDGGTFTGGSGAINFDTYILSGGTFTNTSNTFTSNGNFTVSGSPTFTHNSGTVTFSRGGAFTITPGSISLYNVTFASGGSDIDATISGTLDVNGNLTLTNCSGGIAGGTLTLAGNLTTTDISCGGSLTITFDGTGSQTLGASGGTGQVPKVTINKASGTLTLQDNIEIASGAWTCTTGTVDAGSSTITFKNGTYTISNACSMSFNDVVFSNGGGDSDITVSGTMDVNGDLTIINASGGVSGGTITVGGDISTFDTALGGSLAITLDGTGDQIVSSVTGGQFPSGTFTINKASGTATMSGSLSLGGSLTISDGILQTGKDQTSNLTVGGTLLINSGANLVVRRRHTTGNGSGQTITAATLTINDNGSLNADGQGFNAGGGPGYGAGAALSAHGGIPFRGGDTGEYTNVHTYGSFENPTSLGSGGINNAGGGAIILVVSGTATVKGTLSAVGATSPGDCGAAGGSVNITASVLTGTGTISAKGSSGGCGAGGGGRIGLNGVSSNTFAGTLTVDPDGASGSAGTIYFDAGTRASLTLGGTGHMSSLVLGSDGTNDYDFGDITVNNGGTLTIDSNFQLNAPYGGAATLNVDNLTVNTGGSVNADGRGFYMGQGQFYDASGGGTYGGMGRSSTVNTYGSITDPTSLGTGTVNNIGAGAVIINASGDVTIDGTISANGPTTGGDCGGSGGSVNITADTLSGDGYIKANGSPNGSCFRAGGGGRVAVVLTSGNTFDGVSIQAYPGGDGGGAGTIYKKTASQSVGDVIVDANSASSPAATKISSLVTDTTVGSVTIQNGGKLTMGTGTTLTVAGDWTANVATTLGSGTIVLNGTTQAINGSAATTFYNVRIASGTVTPASTLDVNGSLNIAGGTLVAPSLITVAGNFTKGPSGTFTKGTGTVALDGTGQTMSGSTTFYNLRKKVTSADTLTFLAGSTQTITNVWSMSGATSNLLSLRSSSTGTQWNVDPQGTYKLQYLSVKDSNNIDDTEINGIGFGIGNAGNNTNWFLPVTWVGGTDTTCSTDANWDSGVQPGSTDYVLFNTTTDSISWDASCPTTVDTLLIDDGFDGTISLAGNLTVTDDLTVNEGTLQTGKDVTSNITVSDTMLIGSGGNVVVRRRHTTGNGSGQTITAATLTINPNGSLNANNQGFDSYSGPGGGTDGGAGGTYGGIGSGSADATYGSFTNPTSLGSGGGAGDVGGGAMIVVVSGTMTVQGTVSANAIAPNVSNSDRGAAGGSVNISASVLTGTGTISANGGQDNEAYGGGGRISLNGVTINTFSGTIETTGNRIGTIYLDSASRNSLTLGGSGNMSSLILGSDDSNDYAFGTVNIRNGGSLILDSNPNANAGYGRAARIYATTVTIDSGGTLNADSAGFRNSQGPTTINGSYLGGSHGGLGNGATSGTYDSITNPQYPGSGGGGAGGTSGGGAIVMDISGTLTVNGTLGASGGTGTHSGDRGGAGGTVNITANILTGAGTINANGGEDGEGGGGGGRIAVILESGTTYGTITFNAYGKSGGAAGTIYKKAANQSIGDLLIDNNSGDVTATTNISSLVTDTTVGNVTLQNAGKLTLGTGVTLTVAGDWTANVATNVGSGTVVLSGTGQTIGGSANTTFWNLTKIAEESDDELTFANARTTTIRNDTTIMGSGVTLPLRSDSDGTQFEIDVSNTGTRTIQYVDVQDSNNTNAASILCDTGCVSSGNNTNWSFPWTGVVYTNAGSTVIGAGVTVAMSINGATPVTDTTDAGGAFSIVNDASDGDKVLFYVDDHATNGATVSVTNGQAERMDIYGSHLIVRNDDSGSTTNANIATATDYPDSDIAAIVSATGTTLAMAADTTLFVPATHTYAPGGTVSADNVKIDGTFTMGANDVTVGGDWNSGDGTFTGTNTVTFTGGGTVETGSSEFEDVIFDGPADDADLIGYWKFDETSGTTAVDSSESGNDGVITGTTSSTDVPDVAFTDERSFSFNGAGDRVTIDGLTLQSHYTIAAWTKSNVSEPDDDIIIEMPSFLTGPSLHYYGGGFRAYIAGQGPISYEEANPYAGGVWRHVAMTVSGSTVRLYVDGIERGTTTMSNGNTAYSGTMNIGYRPGQGNYWNGNIDDVRIYDHALSAGEMRNVASSSSEGIGTWSQSGALTVSGDLAIDGGRLRTNGGTLTVDDTYSNDGTLAIKGTELHDLTQDTNSGTTEFYGTGTHTDFSGLTAFNNLTLTGGGTWSLPGATTINGDLLIADSTLTQNSNAMTVGGDWTNDGGTFTSSADVTFTGTGTITETNRFQNITINAANKIVTTDSNLTLSGSLVLRNGMLKVGDSDPTVTVEGTWENELGNFNAGSGTVVLSGTDQTMSGSTAFYNLRKEVPLAATLTFNRGTTQSVRGTWTAKGSLGETLRLRSSTTGQQWRINPAAYDLQYIDVRDSNNISGTTILASNDAVNSGNNTGWAFPISVTVRDAAGNLVGAGVEVNMSVGSGGTIVTSTTNSSGVATFNDGDDDHTVSGVASGALLTMWTDDGVTVTRTNGTTLGFTIRGDTLSLTHQVGSAITNADLIDAETGVGDEIGLFTMSGTTLVMEDETTLRIDSGATYKPGGDVEAHDVRIAGTFAMETNDVTVTGSWDATGGAFTGTNTVIFNSLDTETITVNTSSFHNVIFVVGDDPNREIGQWTTTDDFAVTGSQTVQNTTEVDTTVPVISDVGVDPIYDELALVTWDTNESANSVVRYGTSSGSLTSSATGSGTGLAHAVALQDLEPETTYYFRVYSSDRSNNTATGSVMSFTTIPELSTEEEVEARENIARALGIAEGVASARESTSGGSGGGGGGATRTKCGIQPLAITGVRWSNSKEGATTVTWDTNYDALTIAQYGIDSVSEKMAGNVTEYVKEHSATLVGVKPGTEYKLKAVSIDKCGTVVESEETTFTSDTDISEDLLDDISSETADQQTLVEKALQILQNVTQTMTVSDIKKTLLSQSKTIQDLANTIPGPLLAGEPRVTVTDSSATIAWGTDEDSSSLVQYSPADRYEPDNYLSTVGNPEARTQSHQVTLVGLAPGTTYHFRVRSRTPFGTESASADYTFTTLQQTPEVKTYTIDTLSPTSATVTWQTSVITDARVTFTPYSNGQLSAADAITEFGNDMNYAHKVTTNELESGTVYQVEIAGRTAGGVNISKIIPSYATSTQSLAPQLADIQTDASLSPGKETRIQVIVSWKTDKRTTSKVHYQKGVSTEEGAVLGEETPTDAAKTTKHAIILANLEPGTVYSFQVESGDDQGHVTTSKIFTILTPKKQESVFQVITSEFGKAFGWLGDL